MLRFEIYPHFTRIFTKRGITGKYGILCTPHWAFLLARKPIIYYLSGGLSHGSEQNHRFPIQYRNPGRRLRGMARAVESGPRARPG